MAHSDGPAPQVLPEVAQLQSDLGLELPAISAARDLTRHHWTELERTLAGCSSNETSIVFCGSVARGEATSQSDPDWSFLIDGPADPKHSETAHEIGELIGGVFSKKPGREGVFGATVFSHDLIRHIGGEDDTNRNLTRRLLLLLESHSFGNPRAHDRTIEQVLQRYVEEDLAQRGETESAYVPRFLLNDIARFWRTLAVDFAYKRRDWEGQGIALRDLKLRMSRKLLFASGLISCFSCELGLTALGKQCSHPRKPSVPSCTACIRSAFQPAPLDNLARVYAWLLRQPGNPGPVDPRACAESAFRSYDWFLSLLDDKDRRDHLDHLPTNQLQDDTYFREARDVSHDFDVALRQLFFECDVQLAQLTMKYGVF